LRLELELYNLMAAALMLTLLITWWAVDIMTWPAG
jgi:hypothetical protein